MFQAWPSLCKGDCDVLGFNSKFCLVCTRADTYSSEIFQIQDRLSHAEEAGKLPAKQILFLSCGSKLLVNNVSTYKTTSN